MFNSSKITIFIGVGLVLLAVLRITGLVTLNSKYLLSFSTAALLLIFSDLCNFLLNRFQVSKKSCLQLLQSFFVACSALTIIILPHIDFGWNYWKYLKLADCFSLTGLGITTIIIIGLKSVDAPVVAITLMQEQINLISDLSDQLKKNNSNPNKRKNSDPNKV